MSIHHIIIRWHWHCLITIKFGIMKKTQKYLKTILAVTLMLGTGTMAMANSNLMGGRSDAAFQMSIVSFDYIPVSAHTACFTWTSSKEVNVQEIELQASIDSVTFVTISVQSAYNSKLGHTYYSGVTNVDQYKYFRLSILNENGETDFSKTIHVINTSLTKHDVSLFPNPVTGLSFNVKVPTMNQIAVNVFTKDGTMIYNTTLRGQFQYRINLPASASASMNLIVQVTSNNQTQSFNVLNK